MTTQLRDYIQSQDRSGFIDFLMQRISLNTRNLDFPNCNCTFFFYYSACICNIKRNEEIEDRLLDMLRYHFLARTFFGQEKDPNCWGCRPGILYNRCLCSSNGLSRNLKDYKNIALYEKYILQMYKMCIQLDKNAKSDFMPSSTLKVESNGCKHPKRGLSSRPMGIHKPKTRDVKKQNKIKSSNTLKKAITEGSLIPDVVEISSVLVDKNGRSDLTENTIPEGLIVRKRPLPRRIGTTLEKAKTKGAVLKRRLLRRPINATLKKSISEGSILKRRLSSKPMGIHKPQTRDVKKLNKIKSSNSASIGNDPAVSMNPNEDDGLMQDVVENCQEVENCQTQILLGVGDMKESTDDELDHIEDHILASRNVKDGPSLSETEDLNEDILADIVTDLKALYSSRN